MDGYLKTCEPPQQKDLYIQLIKGVNSLYQKLCSDGLFKSKFQRFYDCFHDLHNDFEDCFGPADWTEDESDSKVCKAYRDITDCYYTKTAKLCGKEAADVMKELMLTVINSILVTKCEDVKINPRVEEPMPEKQMVKSLSKMVSIILIYYVLFTYFLKLFNFQVLSSIFTIILLCTITVFK
ncbi:hypothetical protein ILUMI_01070 [Ignelater luminosus]|uniref:Uncharacterized protein n=1 Tax=Ignelater luminosus TaxID=2038154 RepID=A0A8K0GMJ4_IGNLU|nr:hypothetical protein ILUMI_01070 [Ignelater luminosus]